MIIHSYISLRIHAQNCPHTTHSQQISENWLYVQIVAMLHLAYIVLILHQNWSHTAFRWHLFLSTGHTGSFDVIFDSGKSVDIAHKRWQNLQEDSWKYVCQFVCPFFDPLLMVKLQMCFLPRANKICSQVRMPYTKWTTKSFQATVHPKICFNIVHFSADVTILLPVLV